MNRYLVALLRGVSFSCNTSVAISEEVLENTVWNQIRKGLREELGNHIDQVWFAKAIATEDKETNTLILAMPTRFMADWIRNNYSHVIRRLTGGIGVNASFVFKKSLYS